MVLSISTYKYTTFHGIVAYKIFFLKQNPPHPKKTLHHLPAVRLTSRQLFGVRLLFTVTQVH